jgi:hypothetical protein
MQLIGAARKSLAAWATVSLNRKRNNGWAWKCDLQCRRMILAGKDPLDDFDHDIHAKNEMGQLSSGSSLKLVQC